MGLDIILGEGPFLSESTRDNSQIIGEEKSMQAFLISKKTFPRQPYHKTTPASDGEDGNNASPGQCPQKGCIAIGREIFLDGSFLFSVWRGYRGAPQTMDFIGGQGDQPFVFSLELSK